MLTLGVKLGEMYLKPYFLANPPVHDPFIAIVLGGNLYGGSLGTGIFSKWKYWRGRYHRIPCY